LKGYTGLARVGGVLNTLGLQEERLMPSRRHLPKHLRRALKASAVFDLKAFLATTPNAPLKLARGRARLKDDQNVLKAVHPLNATARNLAALLQRPGFVDHVVDVITQLLP
jgi:hypothetical protein